MAKIIKSEAPVVFRLTEDGDYLMIGSQVGKSMNLTKGTLYKRFPSLWRCYVTAEERELLQGIGISCSNQSMLVKANEIDDILKKDSNNDEVAGGTEGEEYIEEEPVITQDNADEYSSNSIKANATNVYSADVNGKDSDLDITKADINKLSMIVNDLETRFQEAVTVLSSELDDLKSRSKFEATTNELVSHLREENNNLKKQNELLTEKYNNSLLVASDLNRQVEELDHEKKSLILASKLIQYECTNCHGNSKQHAQTTQSFDKQTSTNPLHTDEAVIPIDCSPLDSCTVTKTLKRKYKRPAKNSRPKSKINSDMQIPSREHNTIEIDEVNDANMPNMDVIPSQNIMNKRTQPTETDEVNDADMSIVNEIPSHNSTNERIQTKDLPSNGISKSEYLKPKHCVPCPFLQKKGYCLKGARCDFFHNINPQQFVQSNGRYNDPPVTGNLPSYYNYLFRNSPSANVNAYDYSRPFSFTKLPGEQAPYPLNVTQRCPQFNSPSANFNYIPSPGYAYRFSPFQQSAHPSMTRSSQHPLPLMSLPTSSLMTEHARTLTQHPLT